MFHKEQLKKKEHREACFCSKFTPKPLFNCGKSGHQKSWGSCNQSWHQAPSVAQQQFSNSSVPPQFTSTHVPSSTPQSVTFWELPVFLSQSEIGMQRSGIRSFRLRVVSPTVCSPTVRVDSPTSYMSVRLRVRCWSFKSELLKAFVPCIIPSILSSMARKTTR